MFRNHNHECLPGLAGETAAPTAWSALILFTVALVVSYAFMAVLLLNGVDELWATGAALTGGLVAGLAGRRQARQSPWPALTGLLQGVQNLALR
jgi:hypothetical protein